MWNPTLSLDRYLICRDTVNIYVGALVYHRKHFVDLLVRPLHLQQYGSVRLISYPASHTKHVCGVFRPVTETDALNCTIDKYLFLIIFSLSIMLTSFLTDQFILHQFIF